MKISIDIHRLISLGWNFDDDYYEFFAHIPKEHFDDISIVHFYPSGYKIEYGIDNRIFSPTYSPYSVSCLLKDINEML